MRSYTYYKEAFQGQEMPFAYVDLDLLKENLAAIISRSNGKKIRLASKSIRCRYIIEYLLNAHPQIEGIMAFTAPEAVWLADQGFDDILIGYPVFHEEQIKAICAQIKKGKTIVCMVDSERHIYHLDCIGQKEGVTIPVCIEVDMSVDVPGLHFGVWRSPVKNESHALPIIDKIIESKHILLDGIMGYEAQIAGVGDAYYGQFLKNLAVKLLKKRSYFTIESRRKSVVQAIRDKELSLRLVNGGGTGSMETTCKEEAVTEVTVGSGFFAPGLFDNYSNFKHQPAAAFAIEIVRRPRIDIFTCLGGGYVASGACNPDKIPKPYLPEGLKLTANEAAGEVQTPVIYTGKEQLHFGDPVFLRHSKAGEICERFNSLLLLSEGKIVDKVPTYRGEGKCFL